MTTTSLRADGPLAVATRNPRYFTPTSGPRAGRAVYLTGSHIWNNLHDGMGPGPEGPAEPEQLDYDAYLRFLTDRGHNFIRLWRWEQFRSQAAGGNYHLNMEPQPWARTGPGTAKDGKPRFDLERFDESFFDRLRDRVIRAGEAGIYVGVMLFDGWALHLSPAPDHVEGHPFHAGNNVNGTSVTSIDDLQVQPLDPTVRDLQAAYVRKVVDTVHDLPNVLWEVANESAGGGAASEEFAKALGMDEPPVWGDSTEWQYWVIDVVKQHEAACGYPVHPIGMTMQFPVAEQTRVNEPLLRSAAEWISPGYDDEIFSNGRHPMSPGEPPSQWFADPPVADGAKVILSDTDHYAPGQGDALWAWKSFLRGHHPILMDFGLIGGLEPAGASPADTGEPPFELYEPARWAMGDTRRYAERLNLIDTQPDRTTASTGYALVNPGSEYLVLEPHGDGRAFTVDLPAGSYAVEWFGVASRDTSTADPRTIDAAGTAEFAAPFGSGPAVLYLRRIG
ncbi:hypothetical protein [Cryptosporangium aurantiacum]|uniref:Collagen-binding domain of a collagenase n=1 Tax=Cryptosporangium aurantiacum TaxID=134849 RepID=A0A1M7TX49_9ACTN|nr:hypothetical protein [Cryptosporangium aurantiacum]SHN75324.1 hypothetical protein SAMN05443668_107270 [Cryptosporangium aurantiacum]